MRKTVKIWFITYPAGTFNVDISGSCATDVMFSPIFFFFTVKCTSIRLIRLFVDCLPTASAGNDVTNT